MARRPRSARASRAGAERDGLTVDRSDAVVTTYGAPSPAEDDTIAKLERLAALRESEVLTEEEFAEQKRRLLAGP